LNQSGHIKATLLKGILVKGILGAACSLVLLTGAARAETLLGLKLFADRPGGIEPGTYDTADGQHFTLDPLAEQFLFRLNGGREIFVLHLDRASFGGHVLKYDTGATALTVSVWGGLTLYTDAQPNGLPADRQADSQSPQFDQISLADVEGAAADEARHLSYADKVSLSFDADWNALAQDSGARAVVFDALQNTVAGLDRFLGLNGAHEALAKTVSAIKLVRAASDGVSLSGKTLQVTYDPAQGYAGRPSSRDVAESLSKLLRVRLAD
jgi:hypothetical protein